MRCGIFLPLSPSSSEAVFFSIVQAPDATHGHQDQEGRAASGEAKLKSAEPLGSLRQAADTCWRGARLPLGAFGLAAHES